MAGFPACVACPLAAYATALAVFGFVHVGAEMRFVDRAFARGPADALEARAGLFPVGSR